MTVGKKFRFALTYVAAALIISLCGGAAAWLGAAVVKEPLLTVDYRGMELSLSLAGEEWLLDMTIPERIAQTAQRLWFFFPPKLRLMAQGITWIFQQI